MDLNKRICVKSGVKRRESLPPFLIGKGWHLTENGKKGL